VNKKLVRLEIDGSEPAAGRRQNHGDGQEAEITSSVIPRTSAK